jgi:hypothetical protein
MYRLQGCRFFLVQQTNAEKYTNNATTNTTGVIILLLLGQKQQNNNTKFFIPTFSKIGTFGVLKCTTWQLRFINLKNVSKSS